jgi:hypothetical protein
MATKAAAMPRVSVEIDNERFEGDIVSAPTNTGLMKIKLDSGKIVVRHTFRVVALDQEAREIVGKQPAHK